MVRSCTSLPKYARAAPDDAPVAGAEVDLVDTVFPGCRPWQTPAFQLQGNALFASWCTMFWSKLGRCSPVSCW